ncbi:hypothetical protein [Lederbergia citrea]|uniref:hypothetical protein n=1 Tax=Lederbergia citrea TaxID=2833581 RepID=UPI001BC9B7E2|nr:hypothetical protein [Lederbergia citrea]MBS4204486.1 hypothetical protein [Lederbergia citrea]
MNRSEWLAFVPEWLAIAAEWLAFVPEWLASVLESLDSKVAIKKDERPIKYAFRLFIQSN